MTPHAGLILAGKYRLEAPLARGGMGSVWSARHTTLGSPVAIKFLGEHLTGDATYVARFEREARAAAALQSPHVVQVQDYGVDGGIPYIVMEKLDGEDLNQRLRRVRRLSIPEMHRVLTHAGRALRRAHDLGIVHRDLKPANLFLMRPEHEGDEVVKVLDFGIAKQLHAVGEATGTAEIVGSPHYMSPEHARSNKTVDHRTDIWAMGVITYRALTGELPFPGEILAEILTKVLVDPPPKVHTFAPDLPASLDGFFLRALAKPRDERFQTMQEMVEAFGIAVGAAPAVTSQPSFPAIQVAAAPLVLSDPTPSRVSAVPDFTAPPISTVALSQSGPMQQQGSTWTEANATMDIVGRMRPRYWLWGGLVGAMIVGVTIGLLAWSAGRDPTEQAPSGAATSAPLAPTSAAPIPPLVTPSAAPTTSSTATTTDAPSASASARTAPSTTGVAGPTSTKTTKIRPGGPAPPKTPGWGF